MASKPQESAHRVAGRSVTRIFQRCNTTCATCATGTAVPSRPDTRQIRGNRKEDQAHRHNAPATMHLPLFTGLCATEKDTAEGPALQTNRTHEFRTQSAAISRTFRVSSGSRTGPNTALRCEAGKLTGEPHLVGGLEKRQQADSRTESSSRRCGGCANGSSGDCGRPASADLSRLEIAAVIWPCVWLCAWRLLCCSWLSLSRWSGPYALVALLFGKPVYCTGFGGKC